MHVNITKPLSCEIGRRIILARVKVNGSQMVRDELFALYKLVQNGDRTAQGKLAEEHKKVYPKNYVHHIPKNEWHDAKQIYHMMYLHLTIKVKG